MILITVEFKLKFWNNSSNLNSPSHSLHSRNVQMSDYHEVFLFSVFHKILQFLKLNKITDSKGKWKKKIRKKKKNTKLLERNAEKLSAKPTSKIQTKYQFFFLFRRST